MATLEETGGEPTPPAAAVTELLRAWRAGDSGAEEELMRLLYARLHELAHRKMAQERGGATLQTTALVHEAYLRMIDQRHVEWRDRGHFLALAATMMRRVLVDRARARGADKRGAGELRVDLDSAAEIGTELDLEILDVDLALQRLASTCPRPARVVELRLFGGLGLDEIGALLEVDERTVRRDWAFAVAWLQRTLTPEPQP